MFGRRFVLATLVALGPLALIADTTLANGGAFFDFDRTYYVPGEVVSAETTFSTKVKKSGRIEDGPYYAFLLSSDRWIHAPTIPDDAVPIGHITTTRPMSGAATARITFTVPQIDPGPYTLTFCNLPCTHATLGDLVGGSFSIASTKEEALRKEITDRMNGRIVQVRENLAARIRDVRKAQSSFAARTEVQVLLERVTELEADVARLRNQQAREESGTQTAPWIMAGLLILLSVALLSRRRHRPGSEHAPRNDRGGDRQTIPMFSDAPDDGADLVDGSDRDLDPARL